MAVDRDKFAALVLYIIWKTSHVAEFGSTKLNKVLWFAEARAFEAFGKTITGETFVRDQFGPRSKHLLPVLEELTSIGIVQPFEEQVVHFRAQRYRAVQPPDTSMFSSDELNLIDWWVAQIGDKHTATSISELSHDYGWEVAAMGADLPTFAYLARRLRSAKSKDEVDWAKAESERLGIK